MYFSQGHPSSVKNLHMMKKLSVKRNSGPTMGIAAIALVVVLVVVVAAAGTAAYFLVVKSPSPATTGGSSSTQSSSGGQHSTTSTSSSGSASSSINNAGVVLDANDLFGNFSSMSVEITSSAGPLIGNYSVIGQTPQGLEVNFSTISNGSSQSNLLWFDSNGNLTQATSQGVTYTTNNDSGLLPSFKGVFLSVFGYFFTYGTEWGNIVSQATIGSTQNQAFGPTTLSVTSYTATYNQVSYSVHVGNVPSTPVYLITYWSFSTQGQTDTFQLLSLTRA